MEKQVVDNSPKEGEPWTGITEEELEKKGWKEEEGEWRHPELPSEIYLQKWDSWAFFWFKDTGEFSPVDEEFRGVKYMYQIDNMFHGFTDRWLGYI